MTLTRIIPELWNRLLGRGKHRLAILCESCGEPIEGEAYVFDGRVACSRWCVLANVPTVVRRGTA